MVNVQTIFTIGGIISAEIEEEHPFHCDAPSGEEIDISLVGYPEPCDQNEQFIAFNHSVRKEEREVLWVGDWSVTGMGVKASTCGEHLGLYSDGITFTRTRRSCGKQCCPVDSWKWQAKTGDNASQYLQFVQRELGISLRHASFNPANSCSLVDGKIRAEKDNEGKIIPCAPPGQMEAFKINVLRRFLERFHRSDAGPLGFAYILHPGRENERGSGKYYYSPHVHVITNFAFYESDKEEMKRWYLKYGFTFTMFKHLDQENPDGTYNIKCQDYEDGDGKIQNDLTKKLIYCFSHSLLILKGHQKPVITYNGSFRPVNFDYVKIKRKVFVRSTKGLKMFKVVEDRVEYVEDIIPGKDAIVNGVLCSLKTTCKIFPKRDHNGDVIPELCERTWKKKWLIIWRFKYIKWDDPKEPDDKIVRMHSVEK